MIVSLRLVHCITLAAVCITLAACNTTSRQVQERVIAVPSSKPYRYIKPDPAEDKLSADLVAQIERHNITHWKVKEAEKKARANE